MKIAAIARIASSRLLFASAALAVAVLALAPRVARAAQPAPARPSSTSRP